MSVQAIQWALEQTVGSAGAKAVLLILANYCDKHGATIVGQETVARQGEAGERSVRRHLAYLEERGFIERKPRFNRHGRTSDSCQLAMSQPANLAGTQPDNLAGTKPAKKRTSTGQKVQGYRPKSAGQPANLAGEPLENRQRTVRERERTREEPPKNDGGRAKKKKSPFPDNWTDCPPPDLLGEAITRGFTEREAGIEFEAFQNHHLAKGTHFIDWRRAWLGWLQRTNTFGKTAGGRKQGGQGNAVMDHLYERGST